MLWAYKAELTPGCRIWVELCLVSLCAGVLTGQPGSFPTNKPFGWDPLSFEFKYMFRQPISHNLNGQENLEPVKLLWFYSGKGLIFSHVRGKQNGKQMRNLGKMLHVCRRKSLGMEIKVIFRQHENGISCALGGLSCPAGAVVEKVVPAPGDPSPGFSSVTLRLRHCRRSPRVL